MLSLNSVLISKYSQKLHLRIELVSGAWVVHISLKFWIHLWSKRIWCSLHRFTCCPDLDTQCSKWFHIRSVSGYPSILNMEKRIFECMLIQHSKEKTCHSANPQWAFMLLSLTMPHGTQMIWMQNVGLWRIMQDYDLIAHKVTCIENCFRCHIRWVHKKLSVHMLCLWNNFFLWE